MTATFQWTTSDVTTFFTVYAPDSSYDDVEVDSFYDELQIEINRLPRKNNIVILGDFNASVGEDTYSDWPEVVGKYGFGQHNQRGLQLLQFRAINELIISNTIFSHKNERRYTWTSPDYTVKKQIDFIIMSKTMKSSLNNSRVYQSAEVGSDHFF